MIQYLTLLFAIPLGYILAQTTYDEKQIYTKSQYFPTLLWILAILSTIFLTTSKQLALTAIFLFITTLTWQKA